jgi:imidazolonepropionase-like amidohydrolase
VPTQWHDFLVKKSIPTPPLLSLGFLITLAVVLTVVTHGQNLDQPIAQRTATENGPFALVGGTLIDGSGSPALSNSVVLIRDDRIEQIGTIDSLPVPPSYALVSTEGMTVLPGLWDMHVHLLYAGHTSLQYWHRTYTGRFASDIMPATSMQLLRSGVTSARDLGAPAESIFATKQRIENGEIPGPTIYAAGPQLTPTPPDWAQYYRRGVSGPASAASLASEMLTAGADVLKISGAEQLTIDEIRAITSEAHALGIQVTAHGRTNAEIQIGLEGGVDEFQHIGIGTAGNEYPADLLSAIRVRVASGSPLYWTPTVGLSLRGDYLGINVEALDDPMNYVDLPPLIAEDIRASLVSFSPEPSPVETIRRKVHQLREAGVQLLVGTDAGLPGNFHGQAMWQEMEAWVNVLGIDPLSTIHAATGLAATALGVEEDSGTLTEGKYADVLVVRGDPLQHMAVLRVPVMVFKHGRRID